jgi:hypothetical protein
MLNPVVYKVTWHIPPSLITQRATEHKPKPVPSTSHPCNLTLYLSVSTKGAQVEAISNWSYQQTTQWAGYVSGMGIYNYVQKLCQSLNLSDHLENSVRHGRHNK